MTDEEFCQLLRTAPAFHPKKIVFETDDQARQYFKKHQAVIAHFHYSYDVRTRTLVL